MQHLNWDKASIVGSSMVRITGADRFDPTYIQRLCVSTACHSSGRWYSSCIHCAFSPLSWWEGYTNRFCGANWGRYSSLVNSYLVTLTWSAYLELWHISHGQVHVLAFSSIGCLEHAIPSMCILWCPILHTHFSIQKYLQRLTNTTSITGDDEVDPMIEVITKVSHHSTNAIF